MNRQQIENRKELDSPARKNNIEEQLSCKKKYKKKSRQVGVEPTTFRLGNGRSIHWATGALMYQLADYIYWY